MELKEQITILENQCESYKSLALSYKEKFKKVHKELENVKRRNRVLEEQLDIALRKLGGLDK